MKWVDHVIRFWFDELKPKDWWGGTPAIDATVAARFGDLHRTLSADLPDPATLDGRGHVAAVIVLDQFSRNLHRDAARAFDDDASALALTLDAIERGLDTTLTGPQRQFLYMPLMHSEDAGMQDRSVELFGRIDDPRALHSAKAHRETFLRFGRFPYRNAALGRTSTDEERAFLERKPDPE